MKFRLKVRDFDILSNVLNEVYMSYKDRFVNGTRSTGDQSRKYLEGIFLCQHRGNLCAYSRVVADSDNQSLHHFIANSPWDERGVINRIQKDVSKLIGDAVNGSIHIDETGFPKHGKHSVGAKRQYCGRLGKVEMCQVAVVLGYRNDLHRTLIDCRLYLPNDWATDQVRRDKCGVPEDVVFKSKAQIGLEMVLNARNNGVPFGWIGMDCFYGEDPWLLNRLDSEGLTFIADIPSDTRVWSSLPRTGVPKRNGGRGRHPTRVKVLPGEPQPIEVSKIKDTIDPQQRKRIFVRNTERNQLWADMVCLRVYPVENGLPGKERWLIIRWDETEGKVKYQLSNAPHDVSIDRLAQMSCSRYWVERALEDGKGLAGLADYEVRSWRGWHHHIAMALLAMLVLLMMQLRLGRKSDLITLQDVKEILELIMPKRVVTQEEILEMIEAKHKARESARLSRYRKQNLSTTDLGLDSGSKM